MKHIEVESYDKLSKIAAGILTAQVIMKPNCVLGLATGSTPIGTYKYMIEAYERGDVDFKDVTTVNLDEYAGLDGNNDRSYRYFMNKNLFSQINIDKANTYIPNGCAENLVEEGKRYDAFIDSLGGIDVQLLGIGLDGHIGFNEPDGFFTPETHPVDLDPSTIEANARFFESIDDVPKQAITMGLLHIMQARKILLRANGANKREILEKSFYGKVTPEVPASIMQLHPDVTVIYSKE